MIGNISKNKGGSGGGGGVSQEYVDNRLLPKIELWQPNTRYKQGAVVMAQLWYDEETRESVVLYCIQDTTETNISYPNEAKEFGKCWTTFDIVANFANSAWSAMCDIDGNIITKHYATKKEFENIDLSSYVEKLPAFGLAQIVSNYNVPEKPKKQINIHDDGGFVTSIVIPTYTSDLTNDSGFVERKIEDLSDWVCHELLFKRNTTTLYGEVSDADDTLPISILDTNAVDFESSVVFKTGDVVPPISHEGISISCAGDDCGEDGCFYPQPYRTYELHAKRLGNMYSIRVGVIVEPHTEEA